MDTKKEHVIEEIQAAFDDASLPKTIFIHKAGQYFDAKQAEQELRYYDHWSRVPLETIIPTRNRMSWFTSEAWNFYLPALLIASIEHPKKTDTLKESLLSFLSSSTELSQIILEGLSNNQLKALLEYFKAYEILFPPTQWSYTEQDREDITQVISMLNGLIEGT